MDEFFLQLAELNRAGWAFQIEPESNNVTMPAARAAVIWSFRCDQIVSLREEPPMYLLIDWINLFAPESELRKAVTQMHARVFPISPFGNIPV
ncbi:MAG: hypothetical protein IT331_23365 [Anaerolineae bacterium]|nr:hypothetical protein [Anaerolineae bacterium]